MKRREEPDNSLWWILGGVALVGGGVAAAFALGGDTFTAAERGYKVLDGCRGILVYDAAKLQSFAYARGKAAAPFSAKPTLADIERFTSAANTALGTADSDLSCKDIKTWPADAFVTLYDIFRHYFKGARDAGVLTEQQTTDLVKMIRAVLITQGALADQLPEGLP